MDNKPLPDIICGNMNILFVGYNPGSESAARKHHYANKSNRFWKLLHESGITAARLSPDDDLKLADLGYGSTNIVDRQTRSSDEITKLECVDGCRNLEKMIRAVKPRIVCYMGIGVYGSFSSYMLRSGSAERARPGLQSIQLIEGVFDYVCYNPSGRNTIPYRTQLEYLTGLRILKESLDNIKEVTAAVIIKNGNALIAQRADSDALAGKWEFPGGKTKPGETAKECLKREICEELNLIIEVGGEFGESLYLYENGLIKLKAFICRIVSGNPVLRVHKEIKWIGAAINEKEYDFAPADISLVLKLKHFLSSSR